MLESFGGHREKVSAFAALSVSPKAQRVGLYFATETDGMCRSQLGQQEGEQASLLYGFPRKWADISPWNECVAFRAGRYEDHRVMGRPREFWIE